MTKPLLRAVDAAGRLREAAFALLVRDRQAVTVAALSRHRVIGSLRSPVGRSARERRLARSRDGWSRRWRCRAVVHQRRPSAHARGRRIPHMVRLRRLGHPGRTGFGWPGDSMRPLRQATVRRLRSGRPKRSGPEVVWLAEGGADLRASFCTPTVLLCRDDHGRAWAEAQGGQGELHSVDEASRRGGADWAGCAVAAKRLA
jgi:hypothetical protein